MFARTLKTAVLATAVIAVSASASMAATWGWMEKDTNVRKKHNNGSVFVNYVHEDQKVQIVDIWNNWYKIKIPGQDGWVRANRVDLSPPGPSFPGWGSGSPGGSFCINGDKASFCISGGY